MKVVLFFVLTAVLGYGTGLMMEVIAEGDESKLQTLADTGQFNPEWVPYLVKADLYKINDLVDRASVEYLDMPKFVQIGELSEDEESPINSANLAIDIGINKVIIDNKKSLQNVANMCIFHSPENFEPMCVICRLLDAIGGTVLGEGIIADDREYIGSTQEEIDVFPVLPAGAPPLNPGDPLPNDIQEIMTIEVELCRLQGCTPGFWKTHSELGPASFNAWPTTDFTTGQLYLTVFGINPSGFEIKFDRGTVTNPTLIQALGAEGGLINAFVRHSTAALLSASSDLIIYPDTVAEVIAIVQGVDFTDKNEIEAIKDFFAAQNEFGCSIGSNSPGVLQNLIIEEEGGGGGKKDKKK